MRNKLLKRRDYKIKRTKSSLKHLLISKSKPISQIYIYINSAPATTAAAMDPAIATLSREAGPLLLGVEAAGAGGVAAPGPEAGGAGGDAPGGTPDDGDGDGAFGVEGAGAGAGVETWEGVGAGVGDGGVATGDGAGAADGGDLVGAAAGDFDGEGAGD